MDCLTLWFNYTFKSFIRKVSIAISFIFCFFIGNGQDIQFTKEFSGPAVPGGTVDLTFTITNNEADPFTNIGFADDLDATLAGLTAIGLPMADICRSGSQISGTTLLTFTGGGVPGNGGSCSFSVTLQVPAGAAPGTYPNITSTLLGNLGGSPTAIDPAEDDLVIELGTAFIKDFSPTTIVTGGVSTLTFSIDNSTNVLAATGLEFTDILPAGVQVSNPANTVNTCTGGTLTAVSGSGTISYVGGSVAAGATCTVNVDVTSNVGGTHNNTTGDLTSSAGNSGPASATLMVAPSQPEFQMEFSPSIIEIDESSTLTYMITNPNGAIDFVALGFVDELPAGMVIAAMPNASTTCSGASVNAPAGGNSITFSDGSLNALSSCTITVDVTSGVSGVYENEAELSAGRDPILATAILAVAPELDITLDDSVSYDPSMDQIANPHDSIQYKLTIENQGNGSMNNLLIKEGSDPNTTIDPSTIRATPLAINDEYQLLSSIMNIPATMGVLVNDADVNDPLPNPPFNENLSVLSVQNAPVGTPQTTENGGTVILAGDGGFVYDSTGVHTAISDSFYYKIIDTEGFIDSARVVVFWTRPPLAQNDFFNALLNVANNYPTDTLYADNGSGVDDTGIPTGAIGSFGGGDLGGTVESNVAGSSVPLAGGMLTVESDGSFTLINPNTIGIYTFLYRIENLVGFSDATVTISVNVGPIAHSDQYEFLYTADQNINAATGLFADNGSGADELAFPAATLISFGGGDLGGTVGDQVAGSTVSLAGGDLTVNTDGSWTLTGQPFTPGIYTFHYQISNIAGTSSTTVTLVIQDPPIAQKDSLSVDINDMTAFVAGTLFTDNGFGADHLGTPAAMVISFGGGSLGGDETSYAPGTTQAFAGGTITVNADGSLTVDNPTMDGDYTFTYRLGNTTGFSNAEVLISILSVPVAQDDQYEFLFTADQTVNGAAGLFADNGSGADELAFPTATLTSFGAGDLGGAVGDQVVGSTVSLAGGDLTVNTDGSWTLSGQPFTPGTYTFDYQITNAAGTSTATVTLVIQDPPIAQNDALIAEVNSDTTYLTGSLFADNGSGTDHLGLPVSTITSFGGGDIMGSTDVMDFVAGATTAAGTFAGGTLTVNTDGSFTITNPTSTGDFTFLYRLTNAAGNSDAVVTVSILGPPNGQNDSAPTVLDSTSNPGDNDFHIAINGTSMGIINVFDDNGFGPDDFGNPSALNDMNPDVIQSVQLAGVSDAGTGTIGGGSFSIGGTGSLEITSMGILNFTPPSNFIGIITFEYILANSIGADASPDTVTLAIGERPNGMVDNYTAVGNISISSSNVAGSGVLENDEGDNISVIAVQGMAMKVGMATTTSQGGSVTMGADGEFTYVPLTGFIGDDTFTYTIDNGFGSPSQTTVTISIDDIIYFMDDMAVAGGDGSLDSPFKTIAEHNAAMMPDSSYLFVKDNGNSYSGNLTLNNGETVIGEGSTGSLFGMSSLTNIELPPLSSTVGYSTTGSMTDWVQISSPGNGITLDQNNTLTGLNLGNTSGYGITDNGATVGNLMISQATITGTGGGLSINNGGVINVALNALNSTGNYYGIRLRNVTGTGLQIPGNVTANNSGGSTDIIYLENVNTSMVNIGTNMGSSVTLSNHTVNDAIDITTSPAPVQFGSTTITNSTTGNGVYIHSNSGNVSFVNGGMSITTSSGIGINANTNTGTLSVTGSGNKLTSTTGTSISVINSPISSSHLNFESITASAGSAPAIVLSNTGSAGGLTVIGDNTNTTLGGNNSGGTIGGKTGADGSTTAGIGIYLNNTAHVHLKRMQLNGTFQNFGLLGNDVSNFSLEYCTFSGTFGTSAGEDEGVVSFDGLTGMALVRSSSLAGGLEDIIRIENNSGNLDSLIVENSFIGLNSTSLGNDGILVQTLNNAIVKMRVSDTEFAGARADCMQVNALGNSNVGVKIQRCDFTNAHSNIVVGGGGITLSGGDNTSNITYNYVVDDCVFSGSESYSITANFLSNQGMVTGIISNNTISNSVSGLLAGGEKNGIGGGDLIHKVLISGNMISGVYGGNGIQVTANRGPNAGSRAETYATVINNSVTGMTGNGYTAMRILVGGSAISGDFAFVCADVRGNTLNSSGPMFAANALIADQISSDARFNFPGYAGSANGEFGCVMGTASANLSTYMAGRMNVMTNGPFPSFAGGGVDATLVCGATGSGTNCE